MHCLSTFAIPALVAVGLLTDTGLAADECKCTPTETCWPSTKAWNSLNSTLDGRLIHYTPPAAVCYPSRADYNKTACDSVIRDWSESTFHSGDPASIHSEWGNAGCVPIYENGTSIFGDADAGERGCSNGPLPAYVVNATTTDHVQAALDFATKNNLRLTIKNTGHNGAGRNVGNNSLSIWTHNMKGIQLHDKFKPSCPSDKSTPYSRMAATVGAGVQDGELFETLASLDAMAVGGTSKDVGVTGWATGGGHGLMTGMYGQGADNILEAELVTPSGEVLTVNECQNQDLFWAIRGGGGGTFGVITKMTMKAYPAPKLVMGSFDIAAYSNTTSDAWYKLVAEIHALFPAMQDAGIAGYYTMEGPPSVEVLTFSGSLILFEGSNKTYDQAMEPFSKLLNASSDTVNGTLARLPVNSWTELLEILPTIGSVGGGHSIRASRLISRHTVEENVQEFASVYKEIGPSRKAPSNGLPNLSISGTLTISHKAVNNSLHPAWRNATVHLITGQSWPMSFNESQIRSVVHDMTYRKLNTLRQLDPNSAAYINEANPIEPGWQWSFYGPNYARLRRIKDHYDPEGLLWCPQCVGSEDWLQQQDGTLCRPFAAW